MVKRLLGALALVFALSAAPAQAHFTDSAMSAVKREVVAACADHGGVYTRCIAKPVGYSFMYPCDGWNRTDYCNSGFADYDPTINFYDAVTASTGQHIIYAHYRVDTRYDGDGHGGWRQWFWFYHGQAVRRGTKTCIWGDC